MEDVNKINELFQTQLKDRLKGLEKLRISVILFTMLLVLAIVVFIVVGYLLSEVNNTVLYIWIGIFVLSIGLFGNLISKRKKAYYHQYKATVVAEIIRLIDPTWVYHYDQCIGRTDYHQSELFRQECDRYMGDDFVYGNIDKTDFQFSELHTQYKTYSTDSQGRRHEQWVTIFKGIFMHADFNKFIGGKTFVQPDKAERLFGKLGQMFQKISSKGELIKLENPEFEKMFVVHGSDQIESRYILTPTMMEAMVAIQKKYSRPISYSFIGSRVYLAMSFTKDLFEPRIMSSGVKITDIQEMYDLFKIIEVIIKEMNLNTRIWTKE
ncbi:MAG: DUF3137 domain-containing protein [bacterium]